MKKIKITYVVTFAKNVGVYNVVSNLACNIDKNKYDVSVIACLNDNDLNEVEKLTKNGVKFYCLNFQNKLTALFLGKIKLEKILKKIQPEIVHSHAILADYIVSKISNKYKKVSTIHCNLEEDYLYHYGSKKYKLILKFHIATLKKFDEKIGCSYSVKKSLDNHLNDVKYVVNCLNISNIKTNNLDVRKKLGIKKTDCVYLYVGSLSNRKNVSELIKKFKLHSNNNEHLIIIGSGELYNECISLAEKNIYVLGQIDNPVDYLLASDIYISFSKSEGMPLSAIEALRAGLYLFLSDIESHKEIFDICQNNYIGELFSTTNFKTRIGKIRNSYKKEDKDKIIKIYKEKFNIKNMVKGYCDIYEKHIK